MFIMNRFFKQFNTRVIRANYAYTDALMFPEEAECSV